MGELKHTQLHGLAEYGEATDAVIRLGESRLCVFDQSLENMGYNSPARYQLMYDFLMKSPKCRLSIVVHDPDYLEKRCPRMIALLKQFSHKMAIHQTHPHAADAYTPFILADSLHYARRYHFDDPRGLMGECDPHEAGILQERFSSLWGASFQAISAASSGL